MDIPSPSAQEARTRIRRAQTEGDVVDAVLDYVGELGSEALLRLPEGARPIGLRDRDAIVGFNVELARRELVFAGDEQDARLLREMLAVMTEAAARFAQLAAALVPPKQG